MNIRHAHSKEDPSPDERLLWGALVDDVDALAMLRIGYSAGEEAQQEFDILDVDGARERGWDDGYEVGYDRGYEEGRSSCKEMHVA